MRKPVVVKVEDVRVCPPRFGFVYEDVRHPELAELRKREKLDTVVGDAQNDWEIVCRLAPWSSQRLPFGQPHKGLAVDACSGVGLLRQIDEGYGEFACGTFNRVFQNAINAFGMIARDLNIGGRETRIHQNGDAWHAVTDVWSDHWGKWVYVDAEFALFFEYNGVPLTALEIQQLYWNGIAPRRVFFDGGACTRRLLDVAPSLERVVRYYLDYFVSVDIVMAANHLSPDWRESVITPDGVPQGAPRVFCSPPHHAWRTDYSLSSRMHHVTTSEVADVYWPVNCVELALPLQGREIPGQEVRIGLRTHAPFLELLRVRVDGSEWRAVTVSAAKENMWSGEYEWRLHEGRNVLEAQVVSALGRCGRISRVEVEA